jgi:SAM-dependent methyltransferase
MHAIALARGGYEVLALDTSAALLDVLRQQGAGLPLDAVCANLLDLREHAAKPAALIVCLGDTLTHLESVTAVQRLVENVAASLEAGGRFVATFRDDTRPATGNARFIPVRSDANRIHTCFLEERTDHIMVHDMVHERAGEIWRMHVSSYPKLRLAPDAVADMLRASGLHPTVAQGPRGMVSIVAQRHRAHD